MSQPQSSGRPRPHANTTPTPQNAKSHETGGTPVGENCPKKRPYIVDGGGSGFNLVLGSFDRGANGCGSGRGGADGGASGFSLERGGADRGAGGFNLERGSVDGGVVRFMHGCLVMGALSLPESNKPRMRSRHERGTKPVNGCWVRLWCPRVVVWPGCGACGRLLGLAAVLVDGGGAWPGFETTRRAELVARTASGRAAAHGHIEQPGPRGEAAWRLGNRGWQGMLDAGGPQTILDAGGWQVAPDD